MYLLRKSLKTLLATGFQSFNIIKQAIFQFNLIQEALVAWPYQTTVLPKHIVQNQTQEISNETLSQYRAVC